MLRMRALPVTVMAASAALLSLSCGCKKPMTNEPSPSPSASPSPSPSGERSVLLKAGSANYDRFEGTSFQNACGSDGDCMPSGCASEVCAAESVTTTCDVPTDQPKGNCGCVEGLCVWYTGGAASGGGGMAGCKNDGDCADGKTCVKYYGIAGPGGPQFSSCEHVCGDNQPCPDGTECTTIADGPGQVCR